MGTTLAHTRLTQPDTVERYLGLYLADEDDVDNVSDPAAALIARHSGGELGNPDVTDGLSILFALGNYLVKQYAKIMQANQAKAELAGASGFDDGQQETAA